MASTVLGTGVRVGLIEKTTLNKYLKNEWVRLNRCVRGREYQAEHVARTICLKWE